MKRSTKIRVCTKELPFSTPPCCRCLPRPSLMCRDHPPSPQEDQVALAQAPLRAAGPARAGLSAQRRHIRRALTQAKDAGHAYVVIDGTLISIDRVADSGRLIAASVVRVVVRRSALSALRAVAASRKTTHMPTTI